MKSVLSAKRVYALRSGSQVVSPATFERLTRIYRFKNGRLIAAERDRFFGG